MVTITWTRPTSIISNEIASRRKRGQAALLDMCRYQATDLANRSKSNAKWNDRTGDARAGIGSETVGTGESIEMVVYHAVAYGKYLELGTSEMPKLGVMTDEIHTTAANVTADAQKIVQRLFG